MIAKLGSNCNPICRKRNAMSLSSEKIATRARKEESLPRDYRHYLKAP